MAEFAAGSSAIGVISLGLQVCGGLVKYFDAYRNHGKDTIAVLRRIQSLEGLLEYLASTLSDPGFDGSGAARLVEEELLSCSEGIFELEKMQRKCAAQATSKSGATARQWERAMFPLRRGDLESLGKTLDRLQSSLSFALSMLQTEQQQRLLSQMQCQEDRIIGYVGAVGTQIQAMALNADAGFQMQDRRMVQFEGQLQQLCTDLVPRPQIRQRLRDRVDELTADDSTAGPVNSISTVHHKTGHHSRPSIGCGCICRSYRSRRQWQLPGLLDLRREFESAHLPACPLHLSTRRTAKYGVHANFLWLWRSHAASLTLEIVRGAGSCVLSRSLKCIRIVPDDSPIFMLFWPTDRGTRPTVETVRRQVHAMFRSGQAMPTDVDAHGETVTHAACSFIVRNASRGHGNPDVEQSALLIRDLLLAGSSVDADMWGNAPSWEFLSDDLDLSDRLVTSHSLMFKRPLLELFSFEAEPAPPSKGRSVSTVGHELLKGSREFRDLFSLSPIEEAIYSRSESTLCLALQHDHECITKIPDKRGNALHLASDWPEGLSILLLHSLVPTINQKSPVGETPLHLAVICAEAACVRMLLPHTYVLPAFEWLIRCVGQCRPATFDEIITMFLEEFVTRRTKLRSLALRHLGESDIADLKLHETTILDARARDCWERLHDLGIDYVKELEVEAARHWMGVNMYMCCGAERVDTELLQKLWNLGFRDGAQFRSGHASALDTAFSGSPFLDQLTYLETQLAVIDWLVAHGALDSMDKETETSVLFSLAVRLGILARDSWPFGNIDVSGSPSGIRSVQKLSQAWDRVPVWLLNAFLDLGRRDDCECHCCLAGCSGLDMLWRRQYYFGPSEALTRRIMPMAFLLSKTSGGSRLVAPHVIRAATFERLELRHVCCIYQRLGDSNKSPTRRFRPKDPEEVKEIHEEDRDRIALLETLLPQLAEAYEASGLELYDYLEGPFTARMDEVLKRMEEPMDPENSARLKELGVRLQLVDDDEHHRKG